MSKTQSDSLPGPRDIRPVVPLGNSGNWGMWAFFGVLLIGGVLIFNALASSRQAAQAPVTIASPTIGSGRIASPPPLGLPQRFLEPAPAQETRVEPQLERAQPAPTYAPPPIASPVPSYTPPVVAQTYDPSPRVVFEDRANARPPAPADSKAEEEERVTAGRFKNPSRTIPKGTIIPAVLETAIDSTQGGAVRALVQRDIYGFDGTRILIQRGTRLYGEYEGNLERGQNRARIEWTRLLRPDGVTMNLKSPASDPLGRAGLKGKVDSKFFQRFGGAILQSILDIGVGVATREAGDGVIVALPGSTQHVTQSVGPGDVRPTLKVKHGTSVSVFVARDLDFSTVEP